MRSCAANLVRRDLDHILLKALRKLTAAAVSIGAGRVRRGSRALFTGYRSRASRHVQLPQRQIYQAPQTFLAATAVVAMIMVAGAVAIVREARIARRQQARAERRFNDVAQTG